jgi:cyanophycinase-like exopeptidase
MAGPVALVGSGEYLPAMLEVEAALLAGRPPRYVQLPTAAGREGEASVARWIALGAAQARRLGVEAVPLRVLDRQTAGDEALACQVAGAGLVYLSGGSPAHLADSLRDTPVWAAIVNEWRGGAALAGCSAGAMALTSWVPDLLHPNGSAHPGLGVVPMLRVLPHFDRMQRWARWVAETLAARSPDGVTLVGIEEDTAMVSDGTDLRRWTVRGRQSVWVLTRHGRQRFRVGDAVSV